MNKFIDKKYKKKQHNEEHLLQGRYWATVKLNDGGLIRVIKSISTFYPKGY